MFVIKELGSETIDTIREIVLDLTKEELHDVDDDSVVLACAMAVVMSIKQRYHLSTKELLAITHQEISRFREFRNFGG